MLRLLTDADFNGDIHCGLLRRLPSLDIVRVQEVGLRTADDPEILEWAAKDNRIVLTHDRTTMPRFAMECVRSGLQMPGLFVVRNQASLGILIDEILLIVECSSQDEWQHRVEYLPL